MIRKIVVGLFIMYSSLWLGAAYLIEHKINELSNHGFEYQKISVSGFPGPWKFKLSAPKLTIQTIDEVQVFSSESIGLILSFGLKKIKFALDNFIDLETRSGGQSQFFQIELDPLAKLSLKFARPIVFIANNLRENLSVIKFKSDNIYVSAGDKELAFFEATDIYLKRARFANSDLLEMNFEVNYAGANEIFGFDSMRVSCEGEAEYTVDPVSQKIALKSVNLEDLELDVNENTYLGLFGSVALSKDGAPNGKFDLELQNYSELIDYIWPSNFNITAKEAKDIINEAMDGQEVQEFSLPIIFTDSGLIINGRNLRDLKGGD